jgi:hypothetical protein
MRHSAAELRNNGNQVWYPQFPNPDFPDTADWQELLQQESAMMDEVSGGEKIAIAHSLGTVNWLLGALTNQFLKPFDRVLLVAIPDPAITSQAPGIKGEALEYQHPNLVPQMHKWARSITVLASDQDRWQPEGPGFYDSLALETLIFPGAGHFSLDDGFGPYSGIAKWVKTSNPLDLLSH